MSTKTVDKAKWRRRKVNHSPENDDNDCVSLAWLLNFRLDEFVNVKVPDDDPPQPNVREPKALVPDTPPAPKKPPYTYPELIERALREKGELTVSAIYQWISDRFPYYKASDERWKNSVRHNLSINPHFRKGARASQGAGHLWSLAANAIDLLPLRNNAVYIDDKTGDIVQEAHIIECPKVIVLDEAAIAAASILPDQDIFTGSTRREQDNKLILQCPINSLSDGDHLPSVFLNPVSTEQVVRECGLITAD